MPSYQPLESSSYIATPIESEINFKGRGEDEDPSVADEDVISENEEFSENNTTFRTCFGPPEEEDFIDDMIDEK
jgi:hypothetical protein